MCFEGAKPCIYKSAFCTLHRPLRVFDRCEWTMEYAGDSMLYLSPAHWSLIQWRMGFTSAIDPRSAPSCSYSVNISHPWLLPIGFTGISRHVRLGQPICSARCIIITQQKTTHKFQLVASLPGVTFILSALLLRL